MNRDFKNAPLVTILGVSLVATNFIGGLHYLFNNNFAASFAMFASMLVVIAALSFLNNCGGGCGQGQC